MSGQRRRHNRYRIGRGWIRVSWLDRTGAVRETEARVLNISHAGIAIELPEPLRELATVKLRSAAHGLDGSGVVRRCKFTGLHYVVGLGFEDVVWTPPPGPPPAITTLSGEVRERQGGALDHLARSG